MVQMIDISTYRKMNESQIRSQPEQNVLDVARTLNEKTRNPRTRETFYKNEELEAKPYDAAIALLGMKLD